MLFVLVVPGVHRVPSVPGVPGVYGVHGWSIRKCFDSCKVAIRTTTHLGTSSSCTLKSLVVRRVSTWYHVPSRNCT